MRPHYQHQRPELETDEEMHLFSRRRFLRQSALGITGVGLASLLVACGGDDDDEELPDEDVPNLPEVEEELPADEEDDDD